MKIVSFWIGFLALVLSTALVHAQTNSDDVRRRGLSLYRMATDIIDTNPAGAAALFMTGYETTHGCEFLYNAATAYERITDPARVADNRERAIANYRSFLQSPSATCTSLQGALANNARASLMRLERERGAMAPLVVPPPHVVPTSALRTTPNPRVVTPPIAASPLIRPAPRPLSWALWGGGGAVSAFGVYSMAMGIRNASLSGDANEIDPDRRSRAATYAFIGSAVALGAGATAIYFGTRIYLRQPRVPVPLVVPLVGSHAFGVSAVISF